MHKFLEIIKFQSYRSYVFYEILILIEILTDIHILRSHTHVKYSGGYFFSPLIVHMLTSCIMLYFNIS